METPSGGVSILIRSDVAHQRVFVSTHLHAKAITITAGKNIHTLLYLFSTTKKDRVGVGVVADLNNIVQQLPRTYMLLGDFNAHQTLCCGGSKY